MIGLWLYARYLFPFPYTFFFLFFSEVMQKGLGVVIGSVILEEALSFFLLIITDGSFEIYEI